MPFDNSLDDLAAAALGDDATTTNSLLSLSLLLLLLDKPFVTTSLITELSRGHSQPHVTIAALHSLGMTFLS